MADEQAAGASHHCVNPIARTRLSRSFSTTQIIATVLHMPRERTFDAKSVTLNYLDYGSSSDQPLVMLHGGAWRWQEYLSLIPGLAQGRHIHALDLRGNGRSGWVPDTYRLQDFAEDN